MSFSHPPEDPRSRANLNPALAVRVGIVGSLILGLFAIIFFRLWFLQVLTGTHYVEAAARNTTQRVAIAPARGEILARNGTTVLVSSTTQLAAVIVPEEMPVKVNPSNLLTSYPADDAVYNRLAHLLHKSTKPKPCIVAVPPPSCNTTVSHCPPDTKRSLSPIACAVAQSIAINRYANVTIAEPVSHNLEYYVAERATEFPGVQIQQATTSGYPFKTLAAQTLGTVGRLSQAEQKQSNFKGVNPNAVVGQSGLEYQYDKYLRGSYGYQDVNVNAFGMAVGQGRRVPPVPGDNLRTTLDAKLEQVGEQALQHSIIANHGLGGAFVAMNPQNGSVYAMGSNPSFDPSVFAKPQISQAEVNRLYSPSANNPLFNRAIESEAPDGSTFKVITSVAALQSGVWSPNELYTDTGQYCPPGIPSGSNQCRHNAGYAAYGTLDMASAIKVSDDIFYYHLGQLLNNPRPQGGALQAWARRFGVGRNPHIDIPNAAVGLMSTPAYVDHLSKLEGECEQAIGPYRYTNGKAISATKKKGFHRSPKHPYNAATGTGGCGIAIPNTTWTSGDNINAAIGQGYDELSPLQLAIVYAAIENGGTIVHPHLGQDIQSPSGTVLQKLSFPPLRHLHIKPTYLQTIQQGLHEAAQGGGAISNFGTSQDVMGNFPMPVYGKTGTAQYFNAAHVQSDYAWYSCYVPASATHKPIVIAVWVEGGGYGDIASAPVARQMLSQWFYGKPGPWAVGLASHQ
ncbi:MAG TPA: penicillin-binding transpeptidase domain-containing protein [Solirubrobacteraceae bacterium]|nr:penicillin-binding transpeptidase domain-containing protein [Solirubrobacteraceae bacterium]